jgi:hypothetical protein
MAIRTSGRRKREPRSTSIKRHSGKMRLLPNQAGQLEVSSDIPVERLTVCTNCLQSLSSYVHADDCPYCNFPFRRPGPRQPGTKPYW